MDPDLLFAIILIFTIGAMITGIILINLGMKPREDKKRNLDLIRTGWLVLGIHSVTLTIGLALLCIAVPAILVLFIFLLPLIIILGLVLSLALGIYYLVLGYNKSKPDPKMRNIGWGLLIAHAVVVTAFIVLVIFFMSGLIPIRLM